MWLNNFLKITTPRIITALILFLILPNLYLRCTDCSNIQSEDSDDISCTCSISAGMLSGYAMLMSIYIYWDFIGSIIGINFLLILLLQLLTAYILSCLIANIFNRFREKEYPSHS